MQAFRVLYPFFRPYRSYMIIVLLASLAVTSMGIVTPWVIRDIVQVINEGEGDLDAAFITRMSAILFGAFLLSAFGQYLKAYVAHIVAWNVVSDIQSRLYAHLQTLSLGFYANRQTGELQSRLTGDTHDIEPILAHTIPDGIVYTLMIVGICVMLFILNPMLTLLALLPIPFLVVAVLRFTNGEAQGFRRALSALGMFRAKVQDNLSGMKEIQIFAQEPHEKSQVHLLAKGHTDVRLFALKMQALVPSSVEFAAGIGTLMIVFFGGRMVMAGDLLLADLVAFILYLGLLYQPIRILAYTNEGLQSGLAGVRRVGEILAMRPDVADPPDGREIDRLQGKVTFENVHFAYRDDVPVIQGVSLTVQPGQVLALVGPTGAGKSTLASLVARFYDPQAGCIKLDDIDARDMRLRSLRRNISMVLQDVFLFNGTVKENIRFSRPEATDAEIIEASEIANAHDFIMSLPDGYESVIGERGIKLSGGQKQRLAIARAVLKNAPILILDEATSSVDVQTEAEIQTALAELMKGRTAIVIAHRLSTIRHADIIAVVKDGSVVEIGKHDSLIQEQGLYHQLYSRQFKLAG